MRAIYHRFDGVFDWKRGWSIIIYIYCPGNEAAYWAREHCLTSFPCAALQAVFSWGNLKSGPMAIRRPHSWISDQNWTEEMKEYAKQLARSLLSNFWGVSVRKKTSLYLLKRCREIGQSFEEIQRRGKLVKMVETFWMNIKTIIELEISDDIVLMLSSICIILHIILSPIQ